MPYMLLLGDIRQGIFYAQLLSFWLVFAGEHMLIQDSQHGGVSTLKLYWKHLSAVIVGCLSLFVFDVCERGAQLRNPFYSIWVTKLGANLAVSVCLGSLPLHTNVYTHFNEIYVLIVLLLFISSPSLSWPAPRLPFILYFCAT